MFNVGCAHSRCSINGPCRFRWQQDGSAALTWVESPFFRPHLVIPATRGRPWPRPSPVRAVHLAPPPEEGIRGRGDLGGSPAPSVRAEGARGQGRFRAAGGLGRAERARAEGAGGGGRAGLWGPGNPGAGRKEGGKAVTGLPMRRVGGREAGGPDARVEVLRAASSVRGGARRRDAPEFQSGLDPQGPRREDPRSARGQLSWEDLGCLGPAERPGV
ncbi:unnamed protein product [Rangifer tarandus platyrhynchus]|uniref:Uncharacterized protein n=2 Tax=Rangifer tarandus platyrhynchus TaxID=3082113 RepID=A0ABN8ZGS2_RANTA|nr:unnamed protein product [Rangifer tarandus platyrhynchus]CAI9708575.1 unnamed protein product [Rangifer tarandus platyrhynchus]